MTHNSGNTERITSLSLIPFRISGDTALEKDIHGSVCEQIQKNFARSQWKVRSKVEGQLKMGMVLHSFCTPFLISKKGILDFSSCDESSYFYPLAWIS